jgi:hypothetical protein
MVAVCLALTSPPTPDDTSDALAIAIWAANREGSWDDPRGVVLDRAAVKPLAAGGSPYDRAVREALAREALTRDAASSRANGNGNGKGSGKGSGSGAAAAARRRPAAGRST